jgi:hypothetical protein
MESSDHQPEGQARVGTPVSRRTIEKIVDELEAMSAGHQAHAHQLAALRKLALAGGIQTLETLLPVALALNGKPYHLKNYYPFSPVFDVTMPSRLVLKTGRQVSKTTTIAAHGVLLANSAPNFRTLYVTPLYEQIRRFSNNYVRPFIEQSPIRSLWSGTSTENSVLQRSFKNNSKMIFSFALLDAERVRGVAADKVAIDEVQNIDPGHLPIIIETLSASDWDIMQYTGTARTMDNPIEGLWSKSSQAEWFIKCHSCNTWNIPSIEYHVDAMIGPMHDFISEKIPAVVCHKCRKPINPRPVSQGGAGRWYHRYEDRRNSVAGYHVPQIILPLHYARHDKWAELTRKRAGFANTSQHTFYNEVLGESVDAGQKLVTETDLKKACRLPWRNDVRNPNPAILKQLQRYRYRILAADWSGGGEELVSLTTLALLGLDPTGRIDCLWGKRLIMSIDHLKEALECMHWLKRFGCHIFAHDYTGAGVIRETVLVQAGFDLGNVMAIQYTPPASRSLIKAVPPTIQHNRSYYRLDKTRSLLYTFQAIKSGLLQFFEYDNEDRDNPGLMGDFLALVEEKIATARAGDMYRITKSTTSTDDFAHSVNIGCAAIWHLNGWPDFAHAAQVGRIKTGQIEAAGSADYGWEQDKIGGFYNMP